MHLLIAYNWSAVRLLAVPLDLEEIAVFLALFATTLRLLVTLLLGALLALLFVVTAMLELGVAGWSLFFALRARDAFDALRKSDVDRPVDFEVKSRSGVSDLTCLS